VIDAATSIKPGAEGKPGLGGVPGMNDGPKAPSSKVEKVGP
jgi:hypothetical protein